MQGISFFKVAALFLAAIVSSDAKADSVQELLLACEGLLSVTQVEHAAVMPSHGRCLGLAEGIGAVMTYNCYQNSEEGGNSVFAIEPPPSNGAAIQSFINWARANPPRWGDAAAIGFVAALLEDYPCQN